MARNYEIQTRNILINGSAVATQTLDIGPVVPDGMTRYVTFIRANPMAPNNSEGSKVYLCSTVVNGATTDALASIAQKMVISVASSSTAGCKNSMVPLSPDTEHPLFTVASGAYLRAHQPVAATMSSSISIFVQYYDE